MPETTQDNEFATAATAAMECLTVVLSTMTDGVVNDKLATLVGDCAIATQLACIVEQLQGIHKIMYESSVGSR